MECSTMFIHPDKYVTHDFFSTRFFSEQRYGETNQRGVVRAKNTIVCGLLTCAQSSNRICVDGQRCRRCTVHVSVRIRGEPRMRLIPVSRPGTSGENVSENRIGKRTHNMHSMRAGPC